MPDCPFLSTFDNDIECYRECPLYNYKETGGRCPFTPFAEPKAAFHDYDAFKFEGEKEFVNSIY